MDLTVQSTKCIVSISQTREALLKILGDIPEEDHFGLIAFDDRVSPWKDDLVPGTSDYLAAARTFVKGIRDRGCKAESLLCPPVQHLVVCKIQSCAKGLGFIDFFKYKFGLRFVLFSALVCQSKRANLTFPNINHPSSSFF